MEVKVEVHTVHPSSPSKPHLKNAKSYGAWCSPEDTPITKTSSDVKHQSKADIHQGREALPLQKVRLYPEDYIPTIKAKFDEKETKLEQLLEELEAIKKTKECLELERSPIKEKIQVPDIQTPQSPVPPSPTKNRKGIEIVFSIFDLLLPIDPQGNLYITWLLLVTFCYSYNAWCIPFRATFPYQTPENLPLWLAADYFCDLVYIIDVAIVKPKLMFLHEGFWVDDPVVTKKNYMIKTQYKFDVISLAPLDILYIFFGPEMVVLRFPRLLKLQTFWEFHQAMDRVLSSPYVVRIGKTLFYIFFLIHLNACAYYAMSAYIGLASNGWVYDNQGNAYIRCFYFATKTATSIGKNPKPENTIEYLFMTAAWLMGVFVFALLIGQIRDIIATATRARSEYRKTVDNCVRYLRRANMPSYLQRRVACWFHYTWTTQRCFDEEKILDSLPFNMKRDVALQVHMAALSKVQLFRDCSDSLLRDLVLQLKPVTFLPGDLVVRSGDAGHHMYIIKSGVCFVMSADENEVLAILKEGSVFGEISLLGIDGLRRRTATVRSWGYSNLFALSRMDLEAALEHHQEAANILRLRADQIIRENAARQTKKSVETVEATEAKQEAEVMMSGSEDRVSGSEDRTRRRHSSGARHRKKRNKSKKRSSRHTEGSSNQSITASDEVALLEISKSQETLRLSSRASQLTLTEQPQHTFTIPTIVCTSPEP